MNKNMSFEAAMDRLTEVVKKLEDGGTSLEDSLKLFEEGTALTAFCYEKLQKAEQKITEITALENGEKTDE